MKSLLTNLFTISCFIFIFVNLQNTFGQDVRQVGSADNTPDPPKPPQPIAPVPRPKPSSSTGQTTARGDNSVAIPDAKVTTRSDKTTEQIRRDQAKTQQTIDQLNNLGNTIQGISDAYFEKKAAKEAQSADRANQDYQIEKAKQKKLAADIDKQMESDANEKLKEMNDKIKKNIMDCQGQANWKDKFHTFSNGQIAFGYRLSDFEDCNQHIVFYVNSTYSYTAEVSYKIRLTSNEGKTTEFWGKAIYDPKIKKGWNSPTLNSNSTPFVPDDDLNKLDRLIYITKVEMLDVRVINLDMPSPSPSSYIDRNSGNPWVTQPFDIADNTGEIAPTPKYIKANIPDEITFPGKKP